MEVDRTKTSIIYSFLEWNEQGVVRGGGGGGRKGKGRTGKDEGAEEGGGGGVRRGERGREGRKRGGETKYFHNSVQWPCDAIIQT